MPVTLNIILEVISIVALTLFFIKWLKAEKKLAKYGESTLFKEVEDDSKRGITYIRNDKNSKRG